MTLFSTFNKLSKNTIYIKNSLISLTIPRNFQERFFSQYKEPEFLVNFASKGNNPEMFQPAYLIDSKRMEMYFKHKKDPKEWTPFNLSKRYGVGLMRTKAILYLMKEREELMNKLKVLNLDPKWQEVYEDHLAEPEVMTKEALAEKHSLSMEEINEIFTNMEEHYWRKLNLYDSNKNNDIYLDYLDFADVPTDFKETGHVPGSYSFDFEYDPQLFGDDDFEEVKQKLRERIIRETQALSVKEPLVKSYESRIKNWRKSFTHVPGLREDPVDNPKPVLEDVELSRWKFAFRELRERKTNEPPHPTVIVSRNGSTRLATPLEELQRSWSKKPRGIFASYGAGRLDAYEDPDKDEEKAKAISHNDRIRREKLLRENGLLKRKK